MGWGCRGEEEQEKLEQSTAAEHSGVYRVLQQGVRETDCSMDIFQTDLDLSPGQTGRGRGEGGGRRRSGVEGECKGRLGGGGGRKGRF